ncbi:MAG TPA: arsenosugar biosynthesis-associated peroxidase-like protein [Coleofasciculaceae cyanobacterium]|jgi:4-carboxymuconolactone decarboxylase
MGGKCGGRFSGDGFLLSVLLLGGDRVDQYYKPEHLAQFGQVSQGNPELAEKFFAYYGAVFAEGALSVREKALIALAVSHTVQCPYCIDAYSKECLQQGSDLEEMTEAIHVATAIRGGASLVHGVQMLEHVKKLSM